jgi:hypothetical protein
MTRFSSEERLAKAENDEEFDVTDEEEFIEAVLDAEYKERQLKRRLEDPLGIDSEIEFPPSVLKEKEKERQVSTECARFYASHIVKNVTECTD